MSASPSILTRIRRRLRYLWRGLALSVLILLVGQAWCAWQVYQYAQLPTQLPTHADAAVVLGAAAWGKNPSPVFRERINHALILYQTERVDKLIFTGGTPKKGFPTEAEVARWFAIKQGVPERDIIFETRSKDTYQNLANTRLMMQKHHVKNVIIVTDPYHMARAMTMAQDLGIRASPSPTPTSRYNTATRKTRWRFFVQESYLLFTYRILYFGRKILK
ncbi:YdcF family protein [Wielerella bovis]|uniref:YdcF family protein n=1 Tax=Wielerella bovis TaxID=2917790 RepID=UPI002018DE89|nr:YdcF family protein [Wielerella bovis]ULJ62518.1 YdcF family protein [Wielerella bovis]